MNLNLLLLRDSVPKYSPLPGKKPGREQTPWSPSRRLHFPARHVAAGTPGDEGRWEISRSVSPRVCLPYTHAELHTHPLADLHRGQRTDDRVGPRSIARTSAEGICLAELRARHAHPVGGRALPPLCYAVPSKATLQRNGK